MPVRWSAEWPVALDLDNKHLLRAGPDATRHAVQMGQRTSGPSNPW